MRTLTLGILISLVAASAVSLGAQRQTSSLAAAVQARAADRPPSSVSLTESNALVSQYCAPCHNEQGKARAGSLVLTTFDATKAETTSVVAEKMIRKLRAGMMPPPGARRPDEATLAALATSLETHLDKVWAAAPNPGRRPFQRLNRAEYRRSVHDLLGLDIDVAAFLPPDTSSNGFDNVADVQASSATLMQGYLRAANRISTLAIGDLTASATEATYRVPRTASQMRHVEGAPIGTRGGLSVIHVFPADGEYSFRAMLQSSSGQLFGSTTRGEQLEVSINGERVALIDIDPRMTEADPNGMNVHSPRVRLKAGPQRISAAFIQRFKAPVDDLIAPIEHTMADGQMGLGFGVTTLPHILDFNINGPFNVTGVSESVPRQRIFQCRPKTAPEERACAAKIIRTLASQAYRSPLSGEDFERLMKFYQQGRTSGDFESGIRMALQAILASPRFIFRFEEAPAGVAPGAPYRISDIELASRLSYFLWGTVPDATLVRLAIDGKLTNRAVIEQQVARMLADPRSAVLSKRFASQWLRLQELDKIDPDALLYPHFDRTLADAMRQETESLFDYLVRQDRSVLELLTADYTFVNNRLAKHYGIPNVSGSAFRKVALTEPMRRGILGHGSILTLTSIADRTSPVLRGKWVMEVLLGSPPPPPPPGVPDLAPATTTQGGRLLSVRERMEEHRSNPACTSCHKVMDPLGLALEHFDPTGAVRIKDNGQPIDSSGELYDGTKIDGADGLRAALLKRQDVVLTVFTENLMTFGVARRLESYDMPSVRAIVRSAGERGYKMSAFIMGVIDSPAFRMSVAERSETTMQGQ